MSYKYSKTDEKIDKYLGTTNLRPGPPRRLVNKYVTKNNQIDDPSDAKPSINYSSYPASLSNTNWDEYNNLIKPS
jgi:hypothetical protein